MPRKRVLIVYRSYFPSQSHSGPATAIRNLVTNMSSDYDFHILTLNYDFSTGKRLFDDAHHIAVTPYAVVEYVPKDLRALWILARRLRDNFDIVDIHCAFDPLLAIPALFLCKLGQARTARIFHTPHGIFMNTIMAERSWRKRAFCRAADALGFYKNVTHLAGSAAEMRDIQRQHRKRQNILITSQFVEKPTPRSTPHTKSASSLKIAFVGRIAPQKNLAFALEILRQVSRPSKFDIFGDAGDAGYATRCFEEAKSGVGQCQIRFMGHTDKDTLFRQLQDYDVLLHPTLGENFGHSVVEALHLGLPVLISDRTPWTNVNACNAGWSFPLSAPHKFVEQLNAIYAMDDEWSQFSFGAVEYAHRVFDAAETAQRYRAAYG